MKANFIKTATVFASFVMFASCSGSKDNKSNVIPTVGPSGHITAFGSNNASCDINNGTISCSFLNPDTQQTCSSSSKTYDTQNINSFCSQMQAIYNESLQPNACNVSSVASRILSENCPNSGVNPNVPNPNNPNNGFNPGGNIPGVGRVISCNVTSDNSYPTLMSIPAYIGGHGYSFLTLTERRGGIAGFIGLSRTLGKVEVSYIGAQGIIPETLTASIKYSDRKNNRTLFVKHSGFAGAPLTLNADLNGLNVQINCNQNMGSRIATNDAQNLVCTGDSHVLAQDYDRPSPIQFIRPLGSMNSGEEVQVSEGVSLSIDKATSMLTVRTNVDPDYGPSMTSSSSLKADALIEANEGVGFAKLKCSVK